MVQLSEYRKLLLPLAAFFVFGGISIALWQNRNNQQRELLFRHTETSAEQIKIRVEGLMNARMASLSVLAERWVERTPPDFSRKRFLEFAQAFYVHYPGFFGINWINPYGVIRWVFPEEKNALAREKNVLHHNNLTYRKTFENARQNLKFTVTPCVELYAGGLGFDTFWPLAYGGKVQGYLNGVFQVEHIMEICLAKDTLKNFLIRFYEDDRLIYINEKKSKINHEKSKVQIAREVHFPGKAWRMEVVPRSTVFPREDIENLPLLIFGLTISAMLFLLLYLLLERMSMYRAARDQALFEIKERKRTEEALRENEKRLESLLEELESKNEELETFLYTVSHDLKTPLVTIEGFIGALREDFGKSISEDGEKYLKYMSSAAKKMELLINDLLELSRIRRLTEEKTEIPFGSIVEEVVAALLPQIKERGIEVSIQKDLPSVYGEKKRLTQVVENLLSNAVKYIGKDNPSPRIYVGVKRQDGQNVFFVRDNGIGIEERYFESIFQLFQRLPSGKEIDEGTGVGLTIVKHIIERHGGKLWLNSVPGSGSSFFFTLKRKGD